MGLDQFLKTRSLPAICLMGWIILLLVGMIDYLSGKELSFSILYLFPIYITTWYGNRRLGTVTAFSSGLAWFLAEMFEGNTYSHPLILYWNSSVRLGFFLITTYMLAQLKTRFSLEEKLATTDSLTNIPNRRMFYQVVQAEIVRSGRTGRPFTVAYVDLDKFKLVNDRFGHHAGDELLRIVAQTLQAHVRRLDTTARLGGDEFTILLPELDREAARELLPRLKALVTEAIRAHGWPVTVSLGAVTYLLPPPDVDTILSRADGMMYSAKKDGGDEIYYDVYPGSVEEQPRPGPVIG